VSVGEGKKSTFERHAQTVLGVVVASGIVWLVNASVDQGKELAKTTTQVAQARDEIRALQDQFLRANAERVTTADLQREVRRLEDRIDRELKAKR
jgi:hypothetical protein